MVSKEQIQKLDLEFLGPATADCKFQIIESSKLILTNLHNLH